LSELALWGLLFIGVTQLIWQIPAILLLRRKGLKAVALGVILAVSLVALLNATCWALLSKIRIGG
jgi:hypothetical protein